MRSWLTTRWSSSARSVRRSSSAWWRRRGRHLSAHRHHHGMGHRGGPCGAGRRGRPVTGLAGEPFRYGKPGFRNGNFLARRPRVVDARAARPADYARLDGRARHLGRHVRRRQIRGRRALTDHGLVRALRHRLRGAAGGRVRARRRLAPAHARGNGSRLSCSACLACSPTTCFSWARWSGCPRAARR